MVSKEMPAVGFKGMEACTATGRITSRMRSVPKNLTGIPSVGYTPDYLAVELGVDSHGHRQYFCCVPCYFQPDSAFHVVVLFPVKFEL